MKYYWRNIKHKHHNTFDGPWPQKPPYKDRHKRNWQYVEANSINEALGKIVEIRRRKKCK